MVKVEDVGGTKTVLDKVSSGLQHYPRQVATAKMFGESAQSRKPTWHVTTVYRKVFMDECVCMLRDEHYSKTL